MTSKSKLIWCSVAVANAMNLAILAGAQAPQAASNASPYHVIPRQGLPLPANVVQSVPNGLGEPYVTTCVVSVWQPDPVPAVFSPMPRSIAPTPEVALKRAIERHCGLRISNVQVFLQGQNKAVVHFTAQTEADARLLWDKIDAMEELRAYALDVHVSLPR